MMSSVCVLYATVNGTVDGLLLVVYSVQEMANMPPWRKPLAIVNRDFCLVRSYRMQLLSNVDRCLTPVSFRLRWYTNHHLPLLSLTVCHQSFLQLYLSFGKLAKLVKRQFSQSQTVGQHSWNYTALQAC